MSSPPPALPEEDYEAIEAAVMETARGRWFLAEFARRNRAADTNVLLAAIDRLERLMGPGSEPEGSKPHEPVRTSPATSASAELFAIESQPQPAYIPIVGLPDDANAAWIIEDRAPPPALPSALEVIELDDELIWPHGASDATHDGWNPHIADAHEAPDVAAPPLKPADEARDTGLAASSSQNRMLTSALAAAQDTVARASESPPPRPPGSHSPPSVDPVVLDGLSFDEKIVYFA